MKRLFILFMIISSFIFANSKNSKILDPVYHLDVTKYPKFQAKIILANKKEVLFCCVKSMFYFYLRPYEFP